MRCCVAASLALSIAALLFTSRIAPLHLLAFFAPRLVALPASPSFASAVCSLMLLYLRLVVLAACCTCTFVLIASFAIEAVFLFPRVTLVTPNLLVNPKLSEA